MTNRSVTIQLPDDIYERLRQQAQDTRSTIEEQVVRAVAATMPPTGLPPELEAELDRLSSLDDQSLWNAARSTLPLRASRRLATLHDKVQRGEGLGERETREEEDLIQQYERVMLIRARAAVLLKERGQDISSLGPR